MVKKNIDKSGLSDVTRKTLEETSKDSLAHASGIAGDSILEPVPNYIAAKNEHVIKGQNNTFIVLGRDRPASRLSGYGGLGDTQCGSIDFVVGRMGAEPDAMVFVDPDFVTDAARIHISQKTDIDNNFALAPGKVGNATAKSGIGIKADGVRLIAREGIKLVTGTDEKNSQGGEADAIFGVDLIAGNSAKVDRILEQGDRAGEVDRQIGVVDQSGLQPMVKGYNLVETLEKTMKRIDDLSGILSAFLQAQMKFNASMGTHFHNSPFFGMPTTPSPVASEAAATAQLNMMNDCISGLQKLKYNMSTLRNTYLRQHGTRYINSRFHNLN